MTNQVTIQHAGLAALMQRPLIETIFRRRTHRVGRGSSLSAGSMSYTSSEPRTPLTELEEAVLISLTGCTGLTMPDRPFADPRNGMPIMAKPNLTMAGRTAGSPDNAQGTSFFLINDTGTYFLRKLAPPDNGGSLLDLEQLVARAQQQPAGHHDPVPRRRPLTSIHQGHDVPAHPARRRTADNC
jgi:hypothetical protein